MLIGAYRCLYGHRPVLIGAYRCLQVGTGGHQWQVLGDLQICRSFKLKAGTDRRRDWGFSPGPVNS